MAAHDLRRPVGLILTYSEFLQEGAGPHLIPDHLKYLNSINTAAVRMGNLIDDFLDVSLIEAGRFPLEMMPVDISHLFEEVLRLVEIPAAKRLVSLVMEVESELPRWPADGPKLEQVLTNLISNAIEFSPLGSEVRVGCRQQGTELVFWVTDHGPGMDEMQKKKLFQAFSGSAQRKSDGQRSIGLGLVITNKIVIAHGGKMEVDTIPGHGATFIFTLPAHLPATIKNMTVI
jgi:signal transduction histidine kinase